MAPAGAGGPGERRPEPGWPRACAPRGVVVVGVVGIDSHANMTLSMVHVGASTGVYGFTKGSKVTK